MPHVAALLRTRALDELKADAILAAAFALACVVESIFVKSGGHSRLLTAVLAVAPVSGERITFRQTSADTDGEYLEMDVELTPDGAVPGMHVHPSQEERSEILSSNVRFRKKPRRRVADGVSHCACVL